MSPQTSVLSTETAAASWDEGRGGEGQGKERGGVKVWNKKKSGGRSQRKDYDTFDSNVQIVSFKEEEREREKTGNNRERERILKVIFMFKRSH